MTNFSSYLDTLLLDNIFESVIYLFTCLAMINFSGSNLFQVNKNFIM